MTPQFKNYSDTVYLTFFILLQVKKVIWPAQLKRFSVEEVIKRAFTRLGENWYDFLKNNCEHFVTWSMCGLKVSPQIEQWYLTAREVAYSAFTGLYDFGRNKTKEKFLPLLIKLLANVSDEVAAFIGKNALYVGYGLAILMEVGLAGYEIYKACTYCKTKSLKSSSLTLLPRQLVVWALESSDHASAQRYAQQLPQ